MTKWPKLVEEEYKYYKDNGKCKNAEEFKAFGMDFVADYPPCFVAGNIDHAEYALISLNPGYNEKENKEEKEKYDNEGWERTYLTFFEWFNKKSLFF
jgi:hypothetical protein